RGENRRHEPVSHAFPDAEQPSKPLVGILGHAPLVGERAFAENPLEVGRGEQAIVVDEGGHGGVAILGEATAVASLSVETPVDTPLPPSLALSPIGRALFTT